MEEFDYRRELLGEERKLSQFISGLVKEAEAGRREKAKVMVLQMASSIC